MSLFAVVLVGATARPLAAQVVINEVMARNRTSTADEDGDRPDWVELYNAGAEAVDLADYALTDDRSDLRKWVFPPLTLLSDSYLLVWCSGKDRTAIPEDRLTERDSPLVLDANLVASDDAWSYVSGGPGDAGPPPGWQAPDFDDASWATGVAGFGFGNDDVRTAVPQSHTAVFVRRRFDFRPGQRNLVLELRYDDGFVAYLNGVRVASDNFPEDEEPVFGSTANATHSSTRRERFDLTASLDLLQPGENVLAIVVLNRSETNRDIVLLPALGTVPPVLHTSFKLDSAAEKLVFVDAAGAVRDEVDLPPQTRDMTYGRSPNASGPFRYLLVPSPLAPNDGPAATEPLVVADTKFDHDRGFYEAPFDVAITTETAGAVIRFTDDSSEPTEENGAVYEAPITVTRTTTLRARAFKPGLRSTNVDTHTYVFVDDIITQDLRAVLDAGFPRTWGSTTADYGMDPEVIGPNDRYDGIYAATIRDDLLSLPTLSIVLDTEDMFGPRGIYSNATQGGIAWERAASAELIFPDGGEGFQVNCGIRIQGGAFRGSLARKHSFRLLFKGLYGPTKLNYDWFGDGAVESFDTITLRAGANDGYSWNAAINTEQYTRDEFGRSLQRATGNPGAHGTFVHLYVNGVYWGLYNPVERPDHSFSASYFGGDKDDWDAVHDLAATNGDVAAWNEMVRATAAVGNSVARFQELQGRSPDGTPNPQLPHLLDVPNYVDYLIVNLWGGNWDWPWKNWWAGRDRTTNSTGFKFYCWDYENTIGNNRSRSPLTMNALSNNFSSAGVPHTNLRSSGEYRLLFADRVHRLFFNGGILTPESTHRRYEELANRVERAIVAESARWGDQHHARPQTLVEWERERDWILDTYIPQRPDIVLGQFRGAGLYPSLEAPIFSRHGGSVPAGFEVLARAREGVIYYTKDGADPRLPGGEVAATALEAAAGNQVVLVAAEAPVRIHVPPDGSLGLDWTAVDFDDSAWLEGRTAVGFETESGYEDLIATDVRTILHEVNASIYLRIPFEVEDPSSLVFMTLAMKYDDGFAAYLNGELIAESRSRSNLEWDSRARSSHSDRDAVVFEPFSVDSASSLLKPGRNVLAIHGLNFRATDEDFLIQPELRGTAPSGSGIAIEATGMLRARTWMDGEWSALNEATFIVDSNAPLRITEIMYHPAAEPPAGTSFDRDEFEFIEIRNVGVESLDLSEVRLLGGVEFDFAGAAVETLAPGENVLVVENLTAFSTRYDASAVRIAGQYRGKLSNAGERLRLEGFLGETILDFEYDDAWYSETDGDGYSLEITDPLLAREAWSAPESWRPSQSRGGSPGLSAPAGEDPGGWQRPADVSQDGRVNLTDAVLLLRHLFAGDSPALPCEADSITAAGNLALLDSDGSGSVNLGDATFVLGYLFQEGAPPALGTECVRIRGCPDRCVR